LIPVTIAGKETRLMVDTGTPFCMLGASEAKRLGLRLESAHGETGDGFVT
jgi:predicted aspartyl protease